MKREPPGGRPPGYALTMFSAISKATRDTALEGDHQGTPLLYLRFILFINSRYMEHVIQKEKVTLAVLLPSHHPEIVSNSMWSRRCEGNFCGEGKRV